MNIDSEKEVTVNLLGATPLDFSVNETLASVKSILRSGGFRIVSCFAMGSSPEEITRAGEASVNLVLSSAGIEAARALSRRFGTPYVVGFPTGRFAENVMAAMRDSVMTGENHIAYLSKTPAGYSGGFRFCPDKYNQENSLPEDAVEKVYLIGEAVIAQSIREAVKLEYGLSMKVLCSLETPEPLLDETSEYLASEEELKSRLSDADVVIADPMYRPICPREARFISFPHEAFSGRIYRKDIPDLTRPSDILYNR